MLKIKKNIELTGQSMIEGTQVEYYTAKIESDNPENITFSSVRTDKTLYKDNRAQCRQDAAEFEDAAYALQDELIAEKAATETTE